MMVDIESLAGLKNVSLPDLRNNDDLEGMPLLQKGQRLSVQPVSKRQFEIICKLGGLTEIPN